MKTILILLAISVAIQAQYLPNWDSIDSRPLPKWFDEAKIGIFLHWGVFAVPSFGSEWFWNFWKSNNKQYVDFMDKNFKPNFSYPEFAPRFTAEFYDPDRWAQIFKASGAKYIVLTSKHHEGFTLWPSKVAWNWNAMDVGPKRDLLGDLAKAVRKQSLTFGVYHSMFDWYHPLYLKDKENGFKTQYFVKGKCMPELMELVNTYKPEVIWSDGDWEAPDTYWNSTVFLSWLYNESPVKDTVVVNDRWGIGIPCHHGGYYTCQDRYNPGHLQERKWENAMTVDRGTWGFSRISTLIDYLTVQDLITTLAQTVSCGGNLLINVGPTHDGRIVPIFEERLGQLGAWMDVNGEAIYSSVPWKFQNDTVTPGVWYTSKGDAVYAIVLDWPSGNMLKLGALQPPQGADVTMLGVKGSLKWSQTATGNTLVVFPSLTPETNPVVYGWVLKVVM